MGAFCPQKRAEQSTLLRFQAAYCFSAHNGTATARRQMVYSTELYWLAKCRRAADAPLVVGFAKVSA